METTRETVRATLQRAGESLAGALPAAADNLLRLTAQLDEPCLVAVVGRVKAGKSSFINALLGDDLAKVGTAETTATINYFRYGTCDPARPVRCIWRDGTRTQESRAFLDRLQGNDDETLRLADNIDRLEYLLPSDFLLNVTLVDTPGTGAVVDAHQARTAEFMEIEQALCKRHDQETNSIRDRADAIIYVVGAAAAEKDQDFLDQFREVTGSGARALNAIGVMSKVDIPDMLPRRQRLAQHAASQLARQLTTVLPVSAGLYRTLTRLGQDGLADFVATIRRIPVPRLAKLLDSSEFFLSLDAPVPVEEREALIRGMDWGVLTALANTAADLALALDEIRRRMDDLAGFAPLHETLERYFFQRGHILRCFRVLRDAQAVVTNLRYHVIPKTMASEKERRNRLNRFIGFANAATADRAIAQDLAEYLRGELSRSPAPLLPLIDNADRLLATALVKLEEYNLEFEALQAIEADPDLFLEHEELTALFGRYGLAAGDRVPASLLADPDLLAARQMYWRGIALGDRSPRRKLVAERAAASYGAILGGLE